uniref:Dedicator of cytokinesis protein 7 n=1 Tax=Phallusia mammillata TaxID=59560 RepID=A0A6F9DAK7_9ASCI|nr:dedicator of cytokinesis protein 7 [Phallusia mammillata]
MSMSSEIADILSGLNSAIDVGSGLGTRYGSVKLRSGSQSEGRRQIPSQYLESVSSHASLVENAGYGSNTSWMDVVEPLDLEQEIEAQLEAVVGKDDCIRDLADFPVNDLQMVVNERQHRTLKPPIPKDGLELTTQLAGCIKTFTQDYMVVQRNYEDYSSGKLVQKAKERESDLKSQLPKQVFEGDLEEEPTAEEIANENNSSDQSKSRGSWASSVINLKNSQADVLMETVLDSTPQDEIDEENAKLRSEGRFPHLFSLYLPCHNSNSSSNASQGTFEDSEFPIETLDSPPTPMEHFGYRLLVKCLSLELEMDVEPIFASIALYDTKQKKKISENFHFDLNSDAMKKMMRQEGSASISTLARSAIFSLTHPSHDVFIVIKLEKVLQQGDIGECAEAYMKDATDKQKDKARQNAKWFCDRLGRYRMPFAWTAIHLMNIVNSATNLRPVEETVSNSNGSDDGSRSSTLDSQYRRSTLTRQISLNDMELHMLSSFKPVTLTVSSFFKQEGERLKDEDLYKFLIDLKRPSNILKRLKCIPGKMKIDVSPAPANFPYCITPDLYRVKPYPDQRGRPTREVQEFPAREVTIPNTTYRNLLYIYPQTVNFTNRPNHARNIAVKVELLESEDPTSCLPCIYGKSNAPEYSNSSYTAITYHNKNPDFYEEVKIQLPTRLTSRHHLFFSFYHISCQRKQELTPIETHVGYTWLPLLQGGRLRTGEISLPVSVDKLPPHYSIHSPESQIPGVKWIDGHKAIFSVSIQTVTTVHMLDRYLENFFGLCDLIEHPPSNGLQNVKLADGSRIDDLELELRKSIHALAKESRTQALVNFLHVILDKLVKMLVRPPVISGQTVNMGQNCFEALAVISSRLHRSQEFATDPHLRNILLSTYCKHVFTVPSFERSPGDDAEPEPMGKGSHFATMTRQEKRSRPSVNKSTFHISSSNPDLSAVATQDDAFEEPQNENDRSFVRMSMTRSSLMEQTARHQVDTGVRSVSHKIFHEEIALLFVVSSGGVKESAMQNAWFFFELMTKSMTQYLHETGMMAASRRHRFRPRFLDDLARLVKVVTQEICNKYTRDYDFAERLNCSLAFLIKDFLSIIDRGVVLQLLHSYCSLVNDKLASHLMTSHSSLLQLRVSLLRVVCSHEHYVTLNLPFSIPPTPSSPSPSITSTASSYISSGLLKSAARYDLNERFTRQHFLTGLLLSDIKLSIDLAEQGTTGLGKVQLYAITTLRNLLASHDADERINKNPEAKKAVAVLYLPLLSISIKASQFAYLFNEPEKPVVGDEGMVSSSIASAIANPSPQLARSNTTTNLNSNKMSPECTRNLLVCFIWLLKNTDETTLKTWWVGLSPNNLIAILDLLYISVSCFENQATSNFGRGEGSRNSLKNTGNRKKDSKSRLQEAILGGSSARQELLMRRRGGGGDKAATIGQTQSKDALRWNKNRTEWKQVKHEERMKQGMEDSLIGRNFAAESSMVVLDTLELIVNTATELHDGTSTSQILSCALRLLLHLFSTRQSVSVLRHTFAIQRSIVAKFPELVFEEETEQCADLTLRLLEKCSSSNACVRMHAAASLYMLMRHNFSLGSTFARVKMQVTMSMSSLVGVSHTFDEEFLRRSLKTVLSYAEIDSELEGTSFPEQVRDLVFNLHMILSDTVKMKEHKEDPEMLIDLMYRIAKGYQNSPDLRLTWLQNMANQHSERKNQAEAGMCLLHCAALVAEYLSMMDYKSYLPVGCVTFEKISGNILEESAVSDDVLTSHADEVCSEKYFSPTGLTAILEQAAQTFTLGGLHEVVDMIYGILIPIYEQGKDYKKLAQIHGKLQECFTKISSQSSYGGWERMFGTYFRVGFYGAKFGDLNGEEFIYKEPAITKLPEISHRLEAFYSQCFGAENIEMIKDSSTIDPDSLDPDKAYIQITFVEPYFHEYENARKTSYFERNFNIDKFMYATPFTKDGKAHGEMKEQFKRKTFLQVSNAFPYIKTRISVIKRWEAILTPLESACEDVKKKTMQLLKAVNMSPPDVRMLQVNLQGAVLTSVNQGPMEVANTFLSEIPDEPKLWVHYNELRLSFREFDHACSVALKKNKTLISSDQKEYQREMERNYNQMSEKLKLMVNDRRIVRQILEASNDELRL